VINYRRLRAQLNLDYRAFQRVCGHLVRQGYHAVLHEAALGTSRRLFPARSDTQLVETLALFQRAQRGLAWAEPEAADVFWDDKPYVYWLNAYHVPPEVRPRVDRQDEVVFARLEAGLIFGASAPDDEVVQGFLKGVDDALVEEAGAEPGPHWQVALPTAPEPFADAAAPRFPRAPTGEELTAAALVSDKATRELLLSIKRLPAVVVGELVARRKRGARGIDRATIDALLDAGLLRRQLAVICRRTSRRIALIDAPEKLKAAAEVGMRCPDCGKVLEKERTEELVSVSDFGAKLLNRSHWMSLLVVDGLMRAGVGRDEILTGFEPSPGDETDVLLRVGRTVALLELKDREFGEGDASMFNTRLVKTKAQRGVVITTDCVSAQARETLTAVVSVRDEEDFEIGRPPGRRSVEFVEGISDLAEVLDHYVSSLRLAYVRRLLSEFLAVSPVRLETIIEARLGVTGLGAA
jgi:hypothetical protein